MDPASGAFQSGVSPTPAAPPVATSPSLLTWSMTVQLALGLSLTAGLFFLLGRWSLEWSRPTPVVIFDRTGPALDLNRASKAELRLLPGVGDVLAQRIVTHRDRNGPFQRVDDLRQVHGIGAKTLDRLRPTLFIHDEEPSCSEEEIPNVPMTPTKSKLGQLTGTINVNRADQTELQKLPGIGPKISQRILDTRAKALFKTVDDLRRVPGIGPKTLEKLRPHVAVQ